MLVTITKVGYGDVFPITIPGRCVALVAEILGVLIVVVPITIIAYNF